MKSLGGLMAILRHFTSEVLLSILLGIGAVSAGIGLLGTSAYIIASAALHPSISALQVAIVGVRFFGISRGVLRYFERLVSHSVNLRVVARLRENFYRRVEPGAPGNLAIFKGGDLLQQLMGDLEVLESFYVRVLAPLVIAGVVVIGTSLYIGQYASQLGLIVFIGMGITGFLQPFLSLFLTRIPSHQMASINAQSSAKWLEVIQGLEDIQSCNAQRGFYNRLEDGIDSTASVENRLVMIGSLNNSLSLLWMNLTILAVLWIVIPKVSNNELSGVSLAVILLVVMAAFEAVNPLPAAAQKLNASIIAAKRVFSLGSNVRVRQTEKGINNKKSVQQLIAERLALTFENDSQPVLEDISFDLVKGKKIALVGASGSGKTSLLNIMLAMLSSQSGRIICDGLDLKLLDEDSIRNLFTVLPQNIYIFNENLRENLLVAKPEASDNQLVDALGKAGLIEWFQSLPQGLNTWVGERGTKMSGGEKQRLAAARVFLQDRPFMLLDEPTANLDSLTANLLMESLLEYSKSRGLILVTHDTTWLSCMDEILLLERGRIIERGTLSQLLTDHNEFSRIYQLEKDRLIEN